MSVSVETSIFNKALNLFLFTYKHVQSPQKMWNIPLLQSYLMSANW